jgi:branched-chain amino acid transport system substrate-binding protein
MRAPNGGRRWSRRRFLSLSGLAAGALAAGPIVSMGGFDGWLSGAGRASSKPLRVGALLPRSTIYPDLAANLLAGLRLALGEPGRLIAGRAVELIAADIGVMSSQARRRAAQLLDEGGADLLVGMVSPRLAGDLQAGGAAGETVFIAGGLGENISRPGECRPAVFTHSLSAWQANLALGEWAARTVGPTAVLASSFYDSGYDTLYAFRLGFERAGGTILATHVTHRPHAPDAPGALAAPIAAHRPDLVFAAYCGEPAVEFVRAYATSDLAGRAPLLGSAFLTDDRLLPAHGEAALGITTALGWADDLEAPASRAFADAYRRSAGRAPDAFAALGFETGQLVERAVVAVDGDLSRTERLGAALVADPFTGPRGPVVMRADTQAADGPLYLRQVRRRDGALANAAIGHLAPVAEQDELLAVARAGPKTGWLNAYLHV